MSARRHLFSPFSQSPLSTLLRFNYLRALSFSVSHLSAILPTPSPLFHQKPGGTPHSGHTHASDGPCLSLRNLFSAFRLSVLCVSASLRWVPLLFTRHFLPLPFTIHFRGHTNVTAAGGRSVLQRCFSLRGAAASISASNCWAWSNGSERRNRSARRA
jgi:hypothetical protein